MKVFFTNSAAKAYKKLDGKTKEKIRELVEYLRKSAFPRRYDIKKIAGADRTYRIRLGQFRVVYAVYPEKEHVVILKIDKRSRVYRDL